MIGQVKRPFAAGKEIRKRGNDDAKVMITQSLVDAPELMRIGTNITIAPSAIISNRKVIAIWFGPTRFVLFTPP